ncbi:uncharacterized protein LOC119359448 [Triticum dicoccoides]|uniref:uncharacterized protein LOC119359448 n=1 Tax=Triticum dicoccoides TaxID=85692 RepID=UPI00188ED342|nr:uncharacterized protein LOC119359448 [Triticum dicoccoides]
MPASSSSWPQQTNRRPCSCLLALLLDPRRRAPPETSHRIARLPSAANRAVGGARLSSQPLGHPCSIPSPCSFLSLPSLSHDLSLLSFTGSPDLPAPVTCVRQAVAATRPLHLMSFARAAVLDWILPRAAHPPHLPSLLLMNAVTGALLRAWHSARRRPPLLPCCCPSVPPRPCFLCIGDERPAPR